MASEDPLFSLIKSLSKSEKRHFKLTTSAYSKKNKIAVALFEEIEKMNVYDSERLSNKLSRMVNVKHIPSYKQNLTHLIMRSLRDLSSGKSLESELRRKIEDIYILFDRGLYKMAQKRIVKVIESAKTMNNVSGLLQIKELQWHIAIRECDTNELKTYLSLSEKYTTEVGNTHSVIEEFRRAKAFMYILRTEDSTTSKKIVPTEKLEKLASYPILHQNIDNYPIECRIDYHSIWGYINFIRQNKQAAYHHLKQSVVLYEKAPIEFHFWPMNVHHLLTSLAAFEMYDEYAKELDYVLSIYPEISSSRKHTYFDRELELILIVARMDRGLIKGDIDSIKETVGNAHSFYEDHQEQLNHVQQMVFYYNFSYAYILFGDYKKALYWINLLLNNPDFKELRKDLHAFGEILNICIHYFLGNHQIIPSLVARTQRRFLKAKINNTLIDKFLLLAKKHFCEPMETNTLSATKDFINECSSLRKSDDYKSMTYYFNLPRWMKDTYH